jgi:hypothetical protein
VGHESLVAQPHETFSQDLTPMDLATTVHQGLLRTDSQTTQKDRRGISARQRLRGWGAELAPEQAEIIERAVDHFGMAHRMESADVAVAF